MLLLGQGLFNREVYPPVLRGQDKDLYGLPRLEVVVYVLHKKRRRR